jgi:hypothetical protein
VRNCQEGKKKSSEGRKETGNLGMFSRRAKSKNSLRKVLQGVQKKFENSLSLEMRIEISVQSSRGLAEVSKKEKSSIVGEEIGGRSSRSLGVETSEGLLEENKGLREVAKSNFILVRKSERRSRV